MVSSNLKFAYKYNTSIYYYILTAKPQWPSPINAVSQAAQYAQAQAQAAQAQAQAAAQAAQAAIQNYLPTIQPTIGPTATHPTPDSVGTPSST